MMFLWVTQSEESFLLKLFPEHNSDGMFTGSGHKHCLIPGNAHSRQTQDLRIGKTGGPMVPRFFLQDENRNVCWQSLAVLAKAGYVLPRSTALKGGVNRLIYVQNEKKNIAGHRFFG